MDSLTIPATFDSLVKISAFIGSATTQVGLDDHAAWQVELAVDEAATNIIQHAYEPDASGAITLAWRVDGQQLVIELRSWGRRFDPRAVPVPDTALPLEEREGGGLGIYLMNRLMDVVEYSFDEQHGNLLTMTKHVERPAASVQIFALTGRLDAVSTITELERVHAAIDAGASLLLLDMANVPFMSSSGLRSLLLIRKALLARGGQLRLCSLQPTITEVFTITGFTQVFAIHQTRDEALAAFGQAPV